MNTHRMNRSVRWLLTTGLLLAVILTLAGPGASVARAASFVVTNLNDSGKGSLRQAILAANAAAGADTITFSVSGTITLTTQLEVIAGGPLVIDGANAITISGGGSVRVIYIDTSAALTLENLAISNGSVGGGTPPVCSPSYCGGGIYSAGTLALDHVVLADNYAGSGGGIYTDGTLTISDSTISGNSAGSGGGIYNSGTLEVTGGIFSNNDGSGIYNSGTLTISDSTISDNSGGSGGGISNDGTLTITHSTLSGNQAGGDGGGIDSFGPLTITDSTLSNNHSQRFGGGVSSYGTSTITHSTLSGNDAYRFGGAMLNGGMTTITDSTVWNNGGVSGVGGILNSGTLTISNSNMDSNYAYGECGGSFNSGTLTVTDNSRLAGSGICNVGTLAISNSTLLGSQLVNAEGTELLLSTYQSGPGIMTITNSTLSGNGAPQGGGISNVGTLHVTNSTLSGNGASQGGGIYNAPYVMVAGLGSWGAGILTVTDSTLSDNHANQGGGIFNLGTLDVTGSTLSGNTAYNEGGGIYNAQTVEVGGIPISGPGILTFTNSTLSDNSASQSGGIHNSGTLTVRNSTLSGNHIEQYSTGYEGRGGSITNDAGTVTLYSSILAHTPSGVNCDGAIIDAGYNLEDADTCSLVPANGSLINTDPLLGPLQDNGGPTQTLALLPGSPAIDAALLANCPATDQRGVSRPQGAGCDIGAFELEMNTTYNFSGYFPPVDNLPTLNVVKAGKGIPVKFSLGGDQGLDIFAAGYPVSQEIACDSGTPQDAIEETVTVGASSLSYDAASDTYTYLWKTSKSWAGTCRQLNVKLNDGTEHKANFQFVR